MRDRVFVAAAVTIAVVIAVKWWRDEAPVNQYARYVRFHQRKGRS